MISWSQMSLAKRMGFIVGIILIVIMTISAFLWLTQKEYKVLFTDLEPRDAANVVDELNKLKVDYKLVNEGTQILVIDSMVHETRLKLMGSELSLMGGVGFEVFDNSDFGMTEFAQRINYQRALEGELTRTIVSLNEVKYARVHIVMPEKGLFQTQDNPPSASVTLFLKNSSPTQTSELTEQQIEGIQRLVASSVPYMEPSHVTVTDQNGITLSNDLSNNYVAGLSNRLKQKQALETYMNKKVNDVLLRSFGLDGAMASVDAEIDFNESRKTIEQVLPQINPENGVRKKRETQLKNGSGEDGNGQKITTEIEYELGHSVEQIVELPGSIKQLNVSLMVPEELSEMRVQQIQNLIKTTVGLDEKRGDRIAVYPVQQIKTTNNIFDQQSETITSPEINSDKTEVTNKSNYIDRFRENSLFIISMIVLLSLIGIYLLRYKPAQISNNDTSKELTDEEREKLLSKINHWLEIENDFKRDEATL